MRSPLDKDPFFKTNRQRWTAILLIYSFIVMFCQVHWHIDPQPYITYALTIGSLFILGGSVDSFMKINAAKCVEEKKANRKEE